MHNALTALNRSLKSALLLGASLVLGGTLASGCGSSALDTGGETHFLIKCESNETCIAIDPSWHCRGGYCRTPEDGLDASAERDASQGEGNQFPSGSQMPMGLPSGTAGTRSAIVEPDLEGSTEQPAAPPSEPNEPNEPNPSLEDAGTSNPPNNPSGNSSQVPDPPLLIAGCYADEDCDECQACQYDEDEGLDVGACVPKAADTPCADDADACTADACDGASPYCVHRLLPECTSCVVEDLPRMNAVALSEISGNIAAKAIDGNSSTRWESEHHSTSDTNWIYIDLGVNMYVTEVTLDWGTAAANSYSIDIAADGSCPGNGHGCLETGDPWHTIHFAGPTSWPTTDHRIDTMPVAGIGRYVRMHTSWPLTAYGYSLYDFRVRGTTGTECDNCPNPFLPRVAAVASTENGDNLTANAIDGSTATRWESVHGVDPQWIYVDLGEDRHIDGALLEWETASAAQFTIQVAPDGSCAGAGPGCLSTDDPWTIVSPSLGNTSSASHFRNHIGLDTTGRYVRMHGTARKTAYGYSLWNFSVVGTDPGCDPWPPCGRCETLEGEECVLIPAGTICRGGGECDVAETCDGVSRDCPVDKVKPAGVMCRSAQDTCDLAESCNGYSGSCTGDSVLPLIGVAASSELSGKTADRAIDPVGVYSQWESIHGPLADPSWLYVDLGETFHVTRLAIFWSETSPAKKYQVQVAPDGTCQGSAAGCLRTNAPWTTVYTSPTHNIGDNNNGDAHLTGTGRYVRIYATQQMNGSGYAIRDLNVFGGIPACGPGGLCSDDGDCGDCGNCETNGVCSIAAEGSLCLQDGDSCKQTTCDGVYNLCFYEPETFTNVAAKASTELGGNVAGNVLDNNVNETRWESVHGSDPQWIYVDIGSDAKIQNVKVYWIGSAAHTYEVQVAPNGTCSGPGAGCLGTDQPWVTAASVTNSETGGIRIDKVTLNEVGRYVRIYGTSRTTQDGYSLGHLVVSGNANAACSAP